MRQPPRNIHVVAAATFIRGRPNDLAGGDAATAAGGGDATGGDATADAATADIISPPAPAPAAPPREPAASLLGAILAMVLLRVPRRRGASPAEHAAWIRRKHEDLVAIWRDDVGLLPRATDALDARELRVEGD